MCSRAKSRTSRCSDVTPAVARDRDEGRRIHEADRAQHDDPDAEGGVFTTAEDNQPSAPRGARTARRVGDGAVQQDARQVPARRHPAGGAGTRRSAPHSTSTRTGSSMSLQRTSAPPTSRQIKIEGRSGLKDDEVQRMIREAEAHADEAHKLRELADALNTCRGTRLPDREVAQGSTARSSTSRMPRRSRAGSCELQGVLGVERRRRDQGQVRRASRRRGRRLPRPSTRRRPPRAPDRAATRRRGADDEVIEDAEVVDEEAKTK